MDLSLQQGYLVALDVPARSGRQPPWWPCLRAPQGQSVSRQGQHRRTREVRRAFRVLLSLRPIARTSNIGTNTLIGSSTHIAENVKIVSSVIGQNCTIGAGSELVNAYIFEGTTVGTNCYIEQSIIGSNVKIKDGSKIPKGCLIGDGVILGPSAALEPFDKLSSKRVTTSDADDEEEQDEDEDSDIEDAESSTLHYFLFSSPLSRCAAEQNSFDLSSLGADTNAILWPREAPDEEDDDEESPENWRNQKYMRIGAKLFRFYMLKLS